MNAIKKNYKLLIPIALFIIVYIMDLVYFNVKGLYLINSDTASEMVLASLLNKEGRLITPSWFYSSEIRVLNTNLIYKIGLLVFPNSYHRARLLSIALFMLILGISVIFMMNAIGRLKEGIYAAMAIIAPVGAFYAWNVIYGSFYVPHIAISFFALGIFINTLKCNKIKGVILWGTEGGLLAFLSGLGGVRQLMVCYLPLFAASVVYALIYYKEGGVSPAKGNEPSGNTSFIEGQKRVSAMKAGFFGNPFFIAVLSGYTLLAAGLGYVVNIVYLGKHYSFNAYNEGTLWTKFSIAGMLNAFGDLSGLYGWQADVKVVSFPGIVNALSLVAFGVLFVGMIVGIKNKRQDTPHRVIYLFTGFAFLIQLIIYGNTYVYNESYWIPFWPFLFITGFLFLGDIKESLYRRVFWPAAICFVFLSSVSTMKDPYVDIAPTSHEIMSTAQWFNEEGIAMGYTKGYASFWNANIITELTDGRVELWAIEDYNTLAPRPWLQKVEHVIPPQGRFFIVVNDHECDDQKFMYSKNQEHLIFESSRIKVFGFEGPEEYYHE